MNIIKWKIGDIPPPIEGQLAAAIGNFDGIHQGHVKLLNECKLQAKESNLAFGVVTFDPHPRDFFNPFPDPERTAGSTNIKSSECSRLLSLIFMMASSII